MNDELRERLAKRYYRERWTDDAWETLRPAHKAAYYETVDAILAEIEAAGKVIMDRDRAERLRVAAECYVEVWREECQGSGVPLEECAYGNAGVEPGDLDPLEVGE